MARPTIGSPAPDFTLLDQNGVARTLSEFRSAPTLIYFYPKDDTPGCTKEACLLRDSFPELSQTNVTVLGISPDSVQSHKKFAEKYSLPFMLLADTEKEVVSLYEVWGKKKFMGREYDGVFRTSFLLDKEGKVAKIYENVRPEKHAQEVLEDLVHV
ncbi:thioredoxin-dependent thiol peroxidase [Patescibacteria group bacterium]|nr:thioredoxin-dependent thiol peroxidase [Patescibacteria group bacterium]